MTKKKKAPRTTAMDRLLAEGFFADKDAALPYLMSGAVYCGEQPVRTGGQRVPLDAPMTVRGISRRYVGKGGEKLEAAIRDFGVTVSGRVCVDAGACTGGFTDCLLRHGAERVYAVEAGYGQLAGALRQNPRVVNLERTNLGEERLLSLSPRPDLGSVDLSYLSLLGAVPQFSAIMGGRGELICLVKPLFEIDDPVARRTGSIPAEAYAPMLARLARTLSAREGTRVCGLTHSPVTGNQGTREFFLHVRLGEPPGEREERDWTREAERAVQRALALAPYEKSAEFSGGPG